MGKKISRVLGRAKDGGSCSVCNADYIGVEIEKFYPEEKKGYKVLTEIEPGIVEPCFMCGSCMRQQVEP